MHPSHDDGAQPASGMDVSVFKAIGTLLAAVAEFRSADAIRRLGGPGLYRRLISILATFMTFAALVLVRYRSAIVGDDPLPIMSKAHRHLSHPPAGWAAP